jgi:iron complex transport system permease protein
MNQKIIEDDQTFTENIQRIHHANKKQIAIICLIPVILFFVSLSIGRYDISPVTAGNILISQFFSLPMNWTDVQETVLVQIRLPRVIAVMLVGAGLAASGSAFQGLFRNPLVSSDILGVAAGAGFGAALGILISGDPVIIQILAFIWGIIAVIIAWGLSMVYKAGSSLILVLAGIIVGSFFSAMISLTKYVADPYQKLPAIVFWLMGSMSSTNWKDVYTVSIPIIGGIIILILLRWRITILACGEEEAQSLGIDTTRMAQIIIIVCTVITASGVCISGIIGWVGLVIPHLGRMIVGPDFRRLLPVSIILGASYLLVIDDLARSLTTQEIPLGILTSVIGVPFFAYLLSRKKVGWA